MAIDEGRLQQFMDRACADMGAALSAALVVIGDELGLYRAMNGAGPLSPAELAARTGTHERYVREWLNNQAAGGYVEYDPAAGRYTLPPEQAAALADEDSPAFVAGAFQVIMAAVEARPRIAAGFKTGEGMGWGEYNQSLFEGTDRFFRPGYRAHLTSHWIPALDGVEARLQAGASVADIGCGFGSSTLVMAQAYPQSRFYGFDFHPPSVDRARARAEAAGVAGRVTFAVAGSTDFPGEDYDFVTTFDCLHDMGDPVGAGRRIREALRDEGTWMIVEPFAHDHVEGNLNPVGRVFYGASTLVCVPTSLAQNGPALGTQAGEARLREVARAAGFGRFRRAAETPFNLVLEARP